MEASFVGDKQVNPHKIPESNTRKIPDQELDKREVRRLRAGATDPGTNKLAGAASRDPKDYDTSGRSGQGDTQPQNDPIL